MSIRNIKLKFWQDHGKNTLLVGRSGTGKTECLRDSLTRNGLVLGESAVYYSTHAADFVGDPSKATVILFDDLNDPQAQKAAHEVVGLKVWKGKPVTAFVLGSYTLAQKYEKGSITTDNEPDSLKALFEVVVEMPYSLHVEWFEEQFGKELATAAVRWWIDLNEEEKNKVTPKVLAAALKMYKDKGDMRDVLPITSNVSKLTTAINALKK